MKTFLNFLSEAGAAEQARKKNLVSDRKGKWLDKGGNPVAYTNKGELKFYDKKKKPEEEGGQRSAAQPEEPQGKQKQSVIAKPTN